MKKTERQYCNKGSKSIVLPQENQLICNCTSVPDKTKCERHAILRFIVCSLAKVGIVIMSFAVIKIKS